MQIMELYSNTPHYETETEQARINRVKAELAARAARKQEDETPWQQDRMTEGENTSAYDDLSDC